MFEFNENILIIDGNQVDCGYNIKSVLELTGIYVVLLMDERVFSNNVIAIDRNGKELWKINDILNIEEPCGNTVIKKINDKTFAVISSIGMLYEIDILDRKVNKTMIMR